MPAKPKIAFFDFTSCEGCQLTVVDLLQTHLGLLDIVEIVQFREAMSEKGEDYAVAFIEGSCTRQSDEERLRKIRAQAKIVVALGACAHLGGVNAMKNRWPIDNVQTYVYGKNGRNAYESYPARPISAVIPVDAVIPGCPIDRTCHYIRLLKKESRVSAHRAADPPGTQTQAARLPAMRGVQAGRKCLPEQARQALPRPDHPRRVRSDLHVLR